MKLSKLIFFAPILFGLTACSSSGLEQPMTAEQIAESVKACQDAGMRPVFLHHAYSGAIALVQCTPPKVCKEAK